MHQNGTAEVFLATTALEEFWDVTKPIVFLGEWCRLYSRRAAWEHLDAEVLDGPFDNVDAAHDGLHYVNEVYERMLPQIGSVLNSIHGCHHGDRYWRIVLGPWLHVYLSVIYDRYRHLEIVIKQHPDFTTIGLAEAAYVVPADTLDFACYVLEDSFNLQIYTKILSALGVVFPRRGHQLLQKPLYAKPVGTSWKQKLVATVSKIHASTAGKIFDPVILKNSYFSKSAELAFALKSAGKILPIWGQSRSVGAPEYSSDLRKPMREIPFGKSGFELCLSAMLFSDMPKCFLEGYRSVGAIADADYPKNVKAIFSANAWYFDEVFKQWAAAAAENGAKLLGTQHGGNYGALANMPSENHETAIVDSYYSWGWNRNDCAAEIVPMPASKMSGRTVLGADNQKTGILWVATASSRYLVQFPYLPCNYSEYLLWQTRFAKTLNSEVMTNLRLRPHREDNGWGLVQRLHESIPQLVIETWDVPFQDSLATCRLYVCDHLSTTFVEALAANKPTIIYWSPGANELRPEARPYYDLLRQNGILFDTPESAGQAVNQVYAATENWWNDPARQSAVAVFCSRFARSAPDADALWTAEFGRIAAAPRLTDRSIG